MKTVYIPKGHTVCYESLETEHLVVEGCLKTTCGVKAKTITGGGVLSTGTTSADVICLDELETGSVFCRRLLARRVQTPELFASDSATVSCFLSAAYVETGKLTVAISETDEVKADEVIHLKPKNAVCSPRFCSPRCVPSGSVSRPGTAGMSRWTRTICQRNPYRRPPASLVPYRRSMPIRRISWRLTQNRRRDRLRKQRTSRMKSSTA